MNRSEKPFTPVDSTAPSFEVESSATSVATALESTAVNRYWRHGPGSRAIRLATGSSNDYYYSLGSSLAVAASSDSVLMLGGTVEIFTPVKASVTHIALITTGSTATVNITLGYGQ